ncbi:hypothetical protein NPIL_164471 [Nephila pilipes]|uniref:Uncharacterized protein n=1 Tax=Nephila pilipes TaxID=299642 RepID=A0A8X6Q4D9_NEPPI|nr:hypothetical protein NPIL_164471 [Nephila pilipes]
MLQWMLPRSSGQSERHCGVAILVNRGRFTSKQKRGSFRRSAATSEANQERGAFKSLEITQLLSDCHFRTVEHCSLGFRPRTDIVVVLSPEKEQHGSIPMNCILNS